MVAPTVSNKQISNFFFWLLEAVELMGCRRLASLLWRRPFSKRSLPSKPLSRPYTFGKAPVCCRFVEFPFPVMILPEKGEPWLRLELERFWFLWDLERRRGKLLLLSQRGNGREDCLYAKCRHFLEQNLWSTCRVKHSRHSCAVLLSSRSSG